MGMQDEVENIVTNWHNGNLTDTVELIKEYGETFFEDLEFWLIGHTFYYTDQYRTFAGIAKLYFRHTFEIKGKK